MVKFTSNHRSNASEIMDNFDLQGEEMKLLLTDLRNVNKWLGGYNVTIEGINKLLETIPKHKEITILDIGCGDGEILRQCAKYASENGLSFQLIGVDANEYILDEAKERSVHFNTITYHNINVFSEDSTLPEFDIALCTLFLHHFKKDQIIWLLNKLTKAAKVGVVINDLERNQLAFWLFAIVGKLFIRTKIARHDGLVSIARSFKRRELIEISKAVNTKEVSIKWRWAFRYQWIFKTNYEH